MNRIDQRFASLKSVGKKAVIPYIMTGDPDLATTVDLMHGLVEEGADIIELGMPFSDPMADGPVIALAAERALAGGNSTFDVFKAVKKFREKDVSTPVVLMGYLNPLEIIGYENFTNEATKAGVDGLLIVDLPPEEAVTLEKVLKQANIHLIYLIAPTTTEARIGKIAQSAGGYIYYVSLKGVTGSAVADYQEVRNRIAEIRKQTDLPVGVGFGISNGEIAKQLAQGADAVIVGSALVKELAYGNVDDGKKAIFEKIREIRSAVDTLSNY